MVVAECEIAGASIATDRSAVGSFVLVLRVRDGKIVHWREYQDVLAIRSALG